MIFVAIFPKLAICMLYGRDCDSFTREPKATCYIFNESLLISSYIFSRKLYTTADVHDMLGTNEMKGLETLYE